MNLIDPSGLSGCADMAGQGLSGACLDARNFDSSKNYGEDAVLYPEMEGPVFSSIAQLRSTSWPKENYAYLSSEESGFKFVPREGTNTESSSGDATLGRFTFPLSASAIAHSHPDDQGSPAPGYDATSGQGDHTAINAGRPNAVYHGKTGVKLVVEKSGGQFRVRVNSYGSLNSSERRELRRNIANLLKTYQQNSEVKNCEENKSKGC